MAENRAMSKGRRRVSGEESWGEVASRCCLIYCGKDVGVAEAVGVRGRRLVFDITEI